jgi:hypothetical protein
MSQDPKIRIHIRHYITETGILFQSVIHCQIIGRPRKHENLADFQFPIKYGEIDQEYFEYYGKPLYNTLSSDLQNRITDRAYDSVNKILQKLKIEGYSDIPCEVVIA